MTYSDHHPCWHCGGQHWGDMPGSCPLAPPPEPVDDDEAPEAERCGLCGVLWATPDVLAGLVAAVYLSECEPDCECDAQAEPHDWSPEQ
jgi:hypothetical protein